MRLLCLQDMCTSVSTFGGAGGKHDVFSYIKVHQKRNILSDYSGIKNMCKFHPQLWSPNFFLNTKQDAKIERVSAPRLSNDKYGEKEDSCKPPRFGFGIWEQFWQRQEFEKGIIIMLSNDKYCEKEDRCKPPGFGFGIWEQFWQRQEFEKAIISRPENRCNSKKPEPIKPPQKRFGVWYLSWKISPFAAASIPRPGNNNINGKIEIRKPQQNRPWLDKLGIWQPFPWINQTEMASIPRLEYKSNNKRVKNKCQREGSTWQAFWGINQAEMPSIHRLENKSNNERIENSKPPKDKSWRDKFSVWDLFWSITQTETSSIPKSYNNKNTGKIENKCQQDRPPWEVLWWIKQTETASIPRPENKSNDRKIENTESQKKRSLHDSFGVWEHFWWTNHTERARFCKPNHNNKKIGNTEPLLDRSPQGRLGVWELFWQIYQNQTAGIPKSEKVNSNEKIENKKQLQDRFGVSNVFWQVNKNETTSISGPEKNRNNGKIENIKPQPNKFRMLEHIQQMNLPWNANNGEQAKNAETNELETVGSGYAIPKFNPYMASLPWHTGPRAFLSRMFPRYGNYCGPNWSSGKDGGGLIWDQKPIDMLDHCCYCHDIGYDTHDQGEMLKADISFLECLEKTWASNNGNSRAAEAYRLMCITGLKTVLIPYRKQLLKQMHAKFILARKISGLDSRKSAMQHY